MDTVKNIYDVANKLVEIDTIYAIFEQFTHHAYVIKGTTIGPNGFCGYRNRNTVRAIIMVDK